MKMPTALAPLLAFWQTLHAREQTIIRWAVLLIGLALVWWLLLASPLRTLRQAEAQQRLVDLQSEKMLKLQEQAKVLQAQPRINRDDALRALDASVKQRLGTSAQFNVVGDRATVTLRNTPADALAQWLAEARLNAHVLANEVHLVRTTNAASANSTAPVNAGSALSGASAASVIPVALPQPVVAWDGTLVLMLPVQ